MHILTKPVVRIVRALERLDTLEKKLFWVVSILTTILALACGIATYFEHLGMLQVAAASSSCIAPIVIMMICYKTKQYNKCFAAITLAMNCLSVPIPFLINGGLLSGMPLFCAGCLMLCSFNLDRKLRYLTFAISFTVYLLLFFFSRKYPQIVKLIRPDFIEDDIVISFIVVGIGTLLVCSVVLSEYIQAITNARNEAEHKAQMRIELMEAQLDNVADVRRMRHDTRHHNAEIVEFARNNDMAGLLEYMKQKQEVDEYYATVIYCMNATINNIITVYAGKARKMGITLDIDVEAPNDIPVRKPDLVAMLGNMLENAIHGVMELDTDKKTIAVKIYPKDDKFVMRCVNDCSDELILVDGFPTSHPGTGIVSMCNAARNYNGDCEYSLGNRKLTCLIILDIG